MYRRSSFTKWVTKLRWLVEKCAGSLRSMLTIRGRSLQQTCMQQTHNAPFKEDFCRPAWVARWQSAGDSGRTSGKEPRPVFFFAFRMAQRVERVGNSLCAMMSSLSFGLQLLVTKNRYPVVALKFYYAILIQYVHILNCSSYFQTAILVL